MARYTDSPDEARGRRNLVVAVFFLLLALAILYLPERAQNQLAASFRATALRPFLATQETLTRVRFHAEEASVLQARLDTLATRLATEAPLVEENRRLHEILNLRDRAPDVFLPASVLRAGTPGSESMFLLDVGSERGVQVGDPVIMREGRIGLVGVVQQVQRGSAIGLDWSHPDFRASAMTADGRVFGIVQPVRGLFREQDRLLLDGTPFHTFLEAGTVIVTSGLGGIYPRGIPIGTVQEESDTEGQWRKSYWLQPVVEPGSVRHALVVLGNGMPERMLQLFSEEASDTGRAEPRGGNPPQGPRGGRRP